MANIMIPPVTMRTTTDNPGHLHGVVYATGSSVRYACERLGSAALARAHEAATPFRINDEHADREDAEWVFEVIGLRLQPGHPGSGDDSWLAYGTVSSAGASPWQGSYWDNRR